MSSLITSIKRFIVAVDARWDNRPDDEQGTRYEWAGFVKHEKEFAAAKCELEAALALATPETSPQPSREELQIKHMVERFLAWKLPEDFNPDGGISFKRMFNESTPHPMKHEPVGTNLLDYSQAQEMVRYMVEGLPLVRQPKEGQG